jgi:hypothetical protein
MANVKYRMFLLPGVFLSTPLLFAGAKFCKRTRFGKRKSLEKIFFTKNNFSHKVTKALSKKALLFSSLCLCALVANRIFCCEAAEN